MFEFFFKYSPALFSRGTFVFLNGWPVWLLIAAIIAAAAALGWIVRQRSAGSSRVGQAKAIGVWLFQSALAALLLFLLWHPALSVATLRPQQNIVAVVVDDSSSMATTDEGGGSRKDKAVSMLNSGLLDSLKEKFQVRMYRASDHLQRIDKVDQITGAGVSTHLGDSLKEVVADAASLPIGAVVLMSDGGDNSGGIDLDTIGEVRRQRIPVHTVGFGRETTQHDVEITDVEVPARALPDSRLSATVHFHQHGYNGQKIRINVKDGAKTLASQQVTLRNEGVEQTEQVLFNAGGAGVRSFQISIDTMPSEENVKNNQLTRLVNVDQRKPKILYLEGEPRWEYKFLRRAVEDDRSIEVTGVVRTTQNKTYTQGYDDDPKSVRNGFPTSVDDFFAFDGIIIGSVDAPYLTPSQQDILKQFVERRGGGILWLGGKDSLADGGWSKSALNDLLPVILPDKKNTFVRAPADVELTSAGRQSLVTRIEEDPAKNADRWKKLPYVMNYQDVGQPRPGAVVLADAIPKAGGGGHLPLLILQPYGRGRTAIFATGGSWRWQMLQPVADLSHEMFYQQLLRWVVNDTPRRVTGSTPKTLLADETHVKLRAEVRDKTFLPSGDATVEAHILGPDGLAEGVEMRPEPLETGVYTAEWTTPKPGSYLVEMIAKRGNEELGTDALTFRREDGVAENFHIEQNKELLQKLSLATGGTYYKPDEGKKLGRDIVLSDAGITVRETRDLWDMPIVFLMIVLLRAGEWVLRRKWGVI